MSGANSIERIFSSPGRVRLLMGLLDKGEINITQLSKLGLNYTSVAKHVRALEAEGLLYEKRFGRIRIVCLNEEDARVPLLRKFVREWKRIEQNISVG